MLFRPPYLWYFVKAAPAIPPNTGGIQKHADQLRYWIGLETYTKQTLGTFRGERDLRPRNSWTEQVNRTMPRTCRLSF